MIRKISTKTIGSLLLAMALLFLPMDVMAATPLNDIELKLSIEVQDLISDFDDDGEAVEKERIVIYRLEVINQGSKTLSDLELFMDSPDFMDYVAGSTSVRNSINDDAMFMEDVGDLSPLSIGYSIENLAGGTRYIYENSYQVSVPDLIMDDILYTVGWASLTGPYSAIPVMSNAVNTVISGLPVGMLSINVTPSPSAGTSVFSGSTITYQYQLNNSGGLPLNDVMLVMFPPEGTTCQEDISSGNRCGTIYIGEIASGEFVNIDTQVKVTTTDPDMSYISHTQIGISHGDQEYAEIESIISHPLNTEIQVGTGKFTLMTEQVPNLVLNSSNGSERLDSGDITETQYAIQYTGTGVLNIYNPSASDRGASPSGNYYRKFSCESYTYPYKWGAQIYAYNSNGGGCENLGQCPINSSEINFNITTVLPSGAPDLNIVNEQGGGSEKTENYAFTGIDGGTVNDYMSTGGVAKVPENFTLSRAIADGALGQVNSSVDAVVTEDLWQYLDTGQEVSVGKCSCGDECDYTVYRPLYSWVKAASSPVNTLVEGDEDTTQISVYSSTAWLKTEGGNIGTNGAIVNNQTASNRVNLTFGGGENMISNEYVYDPDTILTPTSIYTPEGATNADYMIFANQGNNTFSSKSGEKWIVTGTDFGNQQYGEAYDRKNNPRNYKNDLLAREKFGKVLTDQLPNTLQGVIDIKDDLVWYQTGDLTIGSVGSGNPVMFAGGQSRIYVEGDVYINSNIFYENSSGTSYNDITSLRIDANNIIINGSVTDLEVLLQARSEFRSGVSNQQLRILGDVITNNAYWERKPVLEIDPDEINRPSEYIIEDLRKYVIPVPGDTELPDVYDIWRQVNPSTGQVLDAY